MQTSFIPLLVFLFSLLQVPAALALNLSTVWPVKGSGTMVKEAREVGRFQGLDLRTNARVVVRQGAPAAVAIEADDNVMPLIDVQVERGQLVVRDHKNFRSSKAEITITAPQIDAISMGGAVAVVADGLNTASLALTMGGASALTLSALATPRLRVDMGGASALKVDGKAADVHATLGGAAAVQAEGLQVQTMTISAGGAAKALVWASESLRLSLGGAAGVRYYGTDNASVSSGGAATVTRLGARP